MKVKHKCYYDIKKKDYDLACTVVDLAYTVVDLTYTVVDLACNFVYLAKLRLFWNWFSLRLVATLTDIHIKAAHQPQFLCSSEWKAGEFTKKYVLQI